MDALRVDEMAMRADVAKGTFYNCFLLKVSEKRGSQNKRFASHNGVLISRLPC
jgi:hypothetical protein